jgi:TRAP-type mannitol/chloroaromatic compound transport system permease small subunit
MLNKFLQGIDLLNEWSGKIFSWLSIPMTLLVTAEVILRYVFNRPTIWVWDVVVQLLGLIIVFSGGYALLKGAHIGVDILVERISKKKSAIIDLFTYPLFLFSMGMLFWITTEAAWNAVETKEAYNSFWRPPIYPFKVAVFVGILLFLLQGIARFIRSVLIVFFRKTVGES